MHQCFGTYNILYNKKYGSHIPKKLHTLFTPLLDIVQPWRTVVQLELLQTINYPLM
jgi:hypothetical protein